MASAGATTRVGQTTFTTPTDTQVRAERVVNAPRELVWACHTVPKHVKQWMLGPDGWTMPVCEIDLRVGGKWHWVWRGQDGTEFGMTGEYREIVAPVRLVNTENWGGDWEPSVSHMELTEHEGRTTITTTATFVSKEARDRAIGTGMNDGWGRSYERLDEYLSSLA